MLNPNQPQINTALTLAWVIDGFMFFTLVVYLILCHTLGNELKTPIDEEQRLLLRTVLYVLTIIGLPITNLIRHVQLRLNQTMPLTTNDYMKEARRRYLSTVIVSLTLVDGIGLFGLVMFMLGDGFNTLHIFLGLSALGLFLYRPKADEYLGVYTALAKKSSL